jgi:hypothetical protein
MKTRANAFGRGCFFVGLAALYFLVGMKAYLAWRDGIWPRWPLGEYLPDGVVRTVFSPETESIRTIVVWLLSRDVVECAAAVCLVLWLLQLVGNGRTGEPDREDAVSR